MELYPDYKSGRGPEEPTEEELLEKRAYYAQMDAAIKGLRYAGIRQVQVSGTEADDLIAIFAKCYEQNGDDVIIYSGDYDLHQLASPTVQILHPDDRKGDKGLLDMQAVLDLWGLPFVHLIPIHKALTGDSSDAIKGVGGIGKKRAALIAPYQHLILSNAERPADVPENVWKYIEKARSNQDIILRNLRLMQLPVNWQQSFYDREQAEQVTRQVLGDGMFRSLRRFIQFCTEWELVTVLENIHYW
jgi:5'-3' exonuclease